MRFTSESRKGSPSGKASALSSPSRPLYPHFLLQVDEIVKFFDGCPVVPNGVVVVYNVRGEGWVAFESAAARELALRKSRNRIGSR